MRAKLIRGQVQKIENVSRSPTQRDLMQGINRDDGSIEKPDRRCEGNTEIRTARS